MPWISADTFHGGGDRFMIAFEDLHEAVFVGPQHSGDGDSLVKRARSLNELIQFCRIVPEPGFTGVDQAAHQTIADRAVWIGVEKGPR